MIKFLFINLQICKHNIAFNIYMILQKFLSTLLFRKFSNTMFIFFYITQQNLYLLTNNFIVPRLLIKSLPLPLYSADDVGTGPTLY